MNKTVRLTRTTAGRAAALALAVVLLLAPVAWALGELEQKPGTAGCISENGSGGACQDGTALAGTSDVAASADGKNVYVTSEYLPRVAVLLPAEQRPAEREGVSVAVAACRRRRGEGHRDPRDAGLRSSVSGACKTSEASGSRFKLREDCEFWVAADAPIALGGHPPNQQVAE
jgi:hypothetical protein